MTWFYEKIIIDEGVILLVCWYFSSNDGTYLRMLVSSSHPFDYVSKRSISVSTSSLIKITIEYLGDGIEVSTLELPKFQLLASYLVVVEQSGRSRRWHPLLAVVVSGHHSQRHN